MGKITTTSGFTECCSYFEQDLMW